MDESFKKLKRKYRLNAIIKGVICGVSFGLLTVGICLLALKLNAVSLSAGYYVLIGVGAAILCGGAVFLIFNPSDKKVAKRLDDDYGLNERTQTTLAYQEKDGVLVELQREDTAAKLRSLPKLKFRFSRIWQYCVIAVLAFAMALTGILVPARQAAASAPPVGSSDYPWRISQLEIIKVRELIANVKTSHLDNDTKTSAADILDGLLTDLETASTVGAKDILVYDAVEKIDGIITPLNNYSSYVNELEIWEQNYLSHAVLRGVIIYKSYKLTTYMHVGAFYNEQFELVGKAIAGPLDALRNEFNSDNELSATILSKGTMIGAAIAASVDSTEDEIYKALDWFILQLAELQAELPEFEKSEEPDADADVLNEDEESEEKSEWQIHLDSIFQSFSDRLSAALEIQAYNFAMNKFIGNNLKLIFNLPIDPDDSPLGEYDPEDPVTQNPDHVTPPDIDEPPELPGFAAKDEIYEPSGSGSGLGGQYVTLDEVYYYYLGILQEMLMSGSLTEEQERIVMAYFDMLTGGLKSDVN